jgi:hypothetical protein
VGDKWTDADADRHRDEDNKRLRCELGMSVSDKVQEVPAGNGRTG